MSDEKNQIFGRSGAFVPGPFEPGTIRPLPPEPAQVILERWWNEDPELRYVEALAGHSLRCCVRLYQITFTDPPFEQVGEGEAGTLAEAAQAAVEDYQKRKAELRP